MVIHLPSTIVGARAIRLPLSSRQRLEIERLIEVGIAILDRADGDVELEDDELYDDEIDIHGDDPQISEDALVYGMDQSEGPIQPKLSGRPMRDSLRYHTGHGGGRPLRPS